MKHNPIMPCPEADLDDIQLLSAASRHHNIYVSDLLRRVLDAFVFTHILVERVVLAPGCCKKPRCND